MKNEKTVAVVVTYNRKILLKECLDALLAQAYPLDAIYIIDNASTDGTSEFLIEKGFIDKTLYPDKESLESIKQIQLNSFYNKMLKIHYVRMHKNSGGAGGFHEGVKRSVIDGFEWLWLMDDDTIPSQDALEVLMSKTEEASKLELPVGFASSKVMFNEEDVHRMNVPQVRFDFGKLFFNSLDHLGIVLLYSASFVSLLVSRRAIIDCGLPIKEYFIWGEDVEFTSRLSKNGFVGIYCKDSRVIHKTKDNHYCDILSDKKENLWKYRHQVRNTLHMKKINKKGKYLSSVRKNLTSKVYKILKYRKDSKLAFIKTLISATIASLFFSPKIEKIPKDEEI
jgi:GT2 family glycosyltransferase